jgi:hypothetical protein
MQSRTCDNPPRTAADPSTQEWTRRAERHRARVAPHAEAFLARRAGGEKHPVWDFLFTYYSFSPGKLVTWMPALWEITNRHLQIACTAGGLPEFPVMTERVQREAAWVAQLCGNIQQKPARFVCHGLHEWAMVYKQSAEQVRHSGYELRMSPEALAAFVGSQTVCCTHYDAFRFYTPAARPLNTLKPSFETRLDMEQGGCLHANMDLYKWAYKLWPWIGSDLVADAFEVAIAGRAMDMRASPYDLVSLGFEPICIETEEGRAEYREEQKRIAALAEPVRQKLRQAALRLAETDVANATQDHIPSDLRSG